MPVTRPSCMTITRSLMPSTSGISDEIISTATPCPASWLTSRWICPECGAIYNVLTQPPAQAGICDRCGARLMQREDDTEETVKRRLNVYESSTAPLIDYYDARHLLSIVNGEGDAEAILERAMAALARRNDAAPAL